MKLNIIHLHSRLDRLQLLEDQLDEQKIYDYKIWPGIIDRDNPKRGIAKAHKQIVQWAKDQGLDSIIIAEDDLKFTAPGAFDFFIKNEPTNFDIYLGGITYGKINRNGSVNDFAGMHLYKIKQKFYDAFLLTPEEKDIDRSLANKGMFVVCNPMVAIQHNGFSDNKIKYENYDPCFKNRKHFGQT